MSNIFEQYNFSIENYIDNPNNVEKLNKINNYLNFALKATILKQNEKYDLETQKNCAKQLLLNYLLGDNSAFTRALDIRNNINKINRSNLINLLIKNSIELDCYNRNILHILEDRLCHQITTDIYNGDYDEMLGIINKDNNILSEIINNYIDLKYQKDDIFIDRLNAMCMSDSLTISALNQLNLGIKLYDQKSNSIKK